MIVNWESSLFLLFLAICSDTIACIVLIRKLWIASELSTRRLAAHLGFVFGAILVESVLQFIGLAFGYPSYSMGFGVSFLIGRSIRSAAIWSFLFFLDGRHSEEK